MTEQGEAGTPALVLGGGAMPFSGRAFAVGAVLGLGEAFVHLAANRSVDPPGAAATLAFAAATTGALCGLAAWPLSRLVRGDARVGSMVVAVGVFLSFQLVDALVGARDARLALMVPACVFLAGAIALAAGLLAKRVKVLRLTRAWAAAGMLLVLTGAALPWITNAGPQQPGCDTGTNVLLISVDTLRADRLGCYGREAAHTPAIDRLAGQSALFEHATTPIPVTGPAHTSMLTGLYPSRHGATENGVPIHPAVPTIADVLARAGYHTAAFVSGWTLKDRAAGLAERFQHFDEDFSSRWWMPGPAFALAAVRVLGGAARIATGAGVEPLERRAASTTDRAAAWIAATEHRPFFAMVHYYDPHTPYAPPAPYDSVHDPHYGGRLRQFSHGQPLDEWQRIAADPRELDHVGALYAGEISYADAQVGRLFEALDRAGVAEHTLVVLTSDHGESLTEHDFYFDHAEFLYDTCVRVPLMIRFPGGRYAGTRWNEQAALVDIAPTLLDALGRSKELAGADGRSLLPVLNGDRADRAAFGGIDRGSGEGRRSRSYVRDGGYKLIWNFDRRESRSARPATEELYDLNADAGETSNLVAAPPPGLDDLRRKLAAWRRTRAPAKQPPSAAVQERLRQLGY